MENNQPRKDIKFVLNNFSEELLREISQYSGYQTHFYNRSYSLVGLAGFCLFIGLFHKPVLWVGIALAVVLVLQYQRIKKLSRSLRVERELSRTEVRKGEEFEIVYNIWNRSNVSCPPITIKDFTMYVSKDVNTLAVHKALGPNRKAQLKYKMKCEAPAGEFVLGACQISVQDELGLFEFQRHFEDDLKIHVRQLHQLNPEIFARKTSDSPFAGDLEIPKVGHGLSLMGVREYQDGDPLSRIVWKKSTLAEEFYVKEFETDVSRRAAFVISDLPNMHIGYGASSTWEVCKLVGLRLIQAYLESHASVSLLSHDIQLKDLNGLDSFRLFEHAVETLKVRPQSERREKSELQLFDYHIKAPALVYFIAVYSPNLETGWIRDMHRLKEDGFEPMLVLIDPKASAQHVRQRFGNFKELVSPFIFEEKDVVQRFHAAGLPVLWVQANTLVGDLGANRYG